MLRIHASVSKKVPIPDQDYSSRQYMAGIEVEVGDGATADALQERIRETYRLLEASVDHQIADTPSRERRIAHGSPNSRNNGKPRRHATTAQVKAIHAIARTIRMEPTDLTDWLRDAYGVESPDALTVPQASEMIDALKNRQAG